MTDRSILITFNDFQYCPLCLLRPLQMHAIAPIQGLPGHGMGKGTRGIRCCPAMALLSYLFRKCTAACLGHHTGKPNSPVKGVCLACYWHLNHRDVQQAFVPAKKAVYCKVDRPKFRALQPLQGACLT